MPPRATTCPNTLHLRLPDGRPILFWVLVLVGACLSGTVWAGLRLIHHHHATNHVPCCLAYVDFFLCNVDATGTGGLVAKEPFPSSCRRPHGA